jgi:hypothetical protein
MPSKPVKTQKRNQGHGEALLLSLWFGRLGYGDLADDVFIEFFWGHLLCDGSAREVFNPTTGERCFGVRLAQ